MAELLTVFDIIIVLVHILSASSTLIAGCWRGLGGLFSVVRRLPVFEGFLNVAYIVRISAAVSICPSGGKRCLKHL